MSLVVSSTTDSQEAVNAAAGIEEAPVEQQEQAVKAPAPAKPAEPDEAEEETEEEGDGEEKEGDEEKPAQPKRLGGWQRKIQALERKNDYLVQRLLEQNQQPRPPQPQPPQQPHQQPVADGRPRQDQFDSYDEYLDKLTDWKLEARLQQEYAAQQQRQQAAAEQERLRAYRRQLATVEAEMPDFDEVLNNVEDIIVPRPLLLAIQSDPLGARLTYELAKQPELLEKIAQSSPLDALTSLAKFKESLVAKTAPPPHLPALAQNGVKPVSRAPNPIRPVGQGAGATSTVPPDQMPLGDYIRWRERSLKAARGKH